MQTGGHCLREEDRKLESCCQVGPQTTCSCCRLFQGQFRGHISAHATLSENNVKKPSGSYFSGFKNILYICVETRHFSLLLCFPLDQTPTQRALCRGQSAGGFPAGHRRPLWGLGPVRPPSLPEGEVIVVPLCLRVACFTMKRRVLNGLIKRLVGH